MATCYYCMNQAASKRWITVSYSTNRRVYVGRRGITGGSAASGSRIERRGVCNACILRMDQEQDRRTVAWVFVLAVAAVGVIAFMLHGDVPFAARGAKAPIVWEDKDAK